MSEFKQFIRIDSNGPGGAGLPAIVHDSSDTAIAGATEPLGYTAYTAPTAGIFTAGVWACNAGTLEIRGLELDEACYLIEGEVVITDRYGNSEHFRAGEAFLLQQGFVGTWHMPVPIKKYNAMCRR